jgi:hypothetical protein
MKTERKHLNKRRVEQDSAGSLTKLYTAPQVEVIEFELTQNFLGSGNAPSNFEGEEW